MRRRIVATTDTKDTSTLAKRGTPSLWPHEFTIPNKDDRLYDPIRMNKEITDERIRNLVSQGQIVPVVGKIRGKTTVLVDGRQRWKRATVINHLVGFHTYKGDLSSILDAIKRIQANTDFLQWIAATVPKGLKLSLTIRRGDEAQAVHALVAANEHRDDDPIADKMRRAQYLYGPPSNMSVEDLADDFGVHRITIQRWLKTDLDKPRAKTARAKPIGPTRKQASEVYERIKDKMTDRERTLAEWFLGRANGVNIESRFGAAAREEHSEQPRTAHG